MERKALFPGSFDPFTLGHKVVVDQALELFDHIVIAVGVNTEKRSLLSAENRVRLIRDLYQDDHRIEVRTYTELTGAFCRELGIRFILRGLRNNVDFEYERPGKPDALPRSANGTAVYPSQICGDFVKRYPRVA